MAEASFPVSFASCMAIAFLKRTDAIQMEALNSMENEGQTSLQASRKLRHIIFWSK